MGGGFVSQTKQKLYFPDNIIDLFQQIQNFTRVISKMLVISHLFFPQNQDLFHKLSRVQHQLATFFLSLQEGFSFLLLHRVHVANQMFLHFCTSGTLDTVDFDALCFKSMMSKIHTKILDG